ncbi:MAG: hypothetical protein R3313_02680 [Candidatus Saccharimonadales bacterium]|nr:hypothetical protein [Candidatus Saccharimonadales bacterium]
MKKKEMQSKSSKQLRQHAEKLANKIADQQQKMITKNESNVRQVRMMKRERARALTIATELETKESEDK